MKNIIISRIRCLLAGWRYFVQTASMHILILVVIALPQNSCSCSLTIESPMSLVSWIILPLPPGSWISYRSWWVNMIYYCLGGHYFSLEWKVLPHELQHPGKLTAWFEVEATAAEVGAWSAGNKVGDNTPMLDIFISSCSFCKTHRLQTSDSEKKLAAKHPSHTSQLSDMSAVYDCIKWGKINTGLNNQVNTISVKRIRAGIRIRVKSSEVVFDLSRRGWVSWLV